MELQLLFRPPTLAAGKLSGGGVAFGVGLGDRTLPPPGVTDPALGTRVPVVRSLSLGMGSLDLLCLEHGASPGGLPRARFFG
jgi:hypothetical protein